MATATAGPGFDLPSHVGCPSGEGVDPPFRNALNLPQYRCNASFFGDIKSPEHPLAVWTGYFVIVGLGISFGIFTVLLVALEQYLFSTVMTSEYFNTAGRSVKTGLSASVIVSQWTWSATLLQSSNVAYLYGVSGPFWYAAGASCQVILFGMLAVLVKLRAPTSHTFLEIIQARWGRVAHTVFLLFALTTSIIVTSMLQLGGSSVVNALTGVNLDVASALIPIGVILYTLAGGLRATFVASYFNTAIIMLFLVTFSFIVFTSHSDIGSPDRMWELLTRASRDVPVANNQNGSYLTFWSRDGVFFGLINLVGNFSTVFIDQSYWQSAIAATPSASWKGFLLGGLCWFAIPFTLATSLGLSSVALSLPITVTEAARGLVPPAAAGHFLGSVGSAAVLVMTFLAVTSSGASEQIAVSSIIAYDVYRTHINPRCSGPQVIFVSRVVILTFGLLMGGLGIALNHLNISLDYLYRLMGVLIGSAVFPVAFSITWGRASGLGAISGALGGLVLGLCSWLGYAATFDGGINLKNTGNTDVMLAGNLMSILSSGIICTLVSFVRPDDCDWSSTQSIPLIEDDPNAFLPFERAEALERAFKRVAGFGVVLTAIIVVLWPLLALPAGVFSRSYFAFYAILSIVWGVVAASVMIILPVWESRHSILVVLTLGMYARRLEAVEAAKVSYHESDAGSGAADEEGGYEVGYADGFAAARAAAAANGGGGVSGDEQLPPDLPIGVGAAGPYAMEDHRPLEPPEPSYRTSF
uniref:Urea active transporter 3.1 n=1 Tax=Bangia sp. ESS1 TaxID=2651159 RepID=A0A7S7YGP7_9RHOD|nr:urea active transporter 3.1 [Bangia sp. ESS1]